MANKRVQSMTTKNDQILVALMSYGSIESSGFWKPKWLTTACYSRIDISAWVKTCELKGTTIPGSKTFKHATVNPSGFTCSEPWKGKRRRIGHCEWIFCHSWLWNSQWNSAARARGRLWARLVALPWSLKQPTLEAYFTYNHFSWNGLVVTRS